MLKPAVGILHTIYAIWHLGRTAASRPPASSASYMLFASTIDAGLVPFFAFTSFVAYREFTEGVYSWGSLFNDAQITSDIVDALFLASAICSGLHVLSFIISVYLAILFRQIAKLPPDMNPLEDNLTARPHKRSKSEWKEKHLSSSTLDSAQSHTKSVLDDSSVDVPRAIPFSHTRQGSSVTDSSQRLSRTDLPSQQRRLYEQSNQSNSSLTRSSAQRLRDLPSPRPGSLVLEEAPVLRPTSSRYLPTDFRWGSPAPSHDSDNWVTYPSPTSSPVNENVARQLSPNPSRNSSPQSMYSAVSDWLGPIPQFGRVESSQPQRGDYAVLQGHEFYGNDDHEEDDDIVVGKENVEQDLGDRSYNPLAMNPPTPQPKEDGLEPETKRKSSLRRVALTDLPNPSVREHHDMPEITSYDSVNRFYADLGGKAAGLSVQRATSNQVSSPSKGEKLKTFGSKRLWRRKSGKSSAYESVKAKEDEEDEDDNASAADSDDDDDNNNIPALTGKRRTTTAGSTDGDRKGRVVSNSGVDLGTGFQLGVGSNSYGSYISGLGVGRRRDVSGKVAEEGRGGSVVEREEDTPDKKRGTGRAAGWARFAGL